MSTTPPKVLRNIYLRVDENLTYEAIQEGVHYDLYVIKRGRRTLVTSFLDNVPEPDGTKILLQHLPVSHLPLLLNHKQESVRHAALSRLSKT